MFSLPTKAVSIQPDKIESGLSRMVKIPSTDGSNSPYLKLRQELLGQARKERQSELGELHSSITTFDLALRNLSENFEKRVKVQDALTRLTQFNLTPTQGLFDALPEKLKASLSMNFGELSYGSVSNHRLLVCATTGVERILRLELPNILPIEKESLGKAIQALDELIPRFTKTAERYDSAKDSDVRERVLKSSATLKTLSEEFRESLSKDPSKSREILLSMAKCATDIQESFLYIQHHLPLNRIRLMSKESEGRAESGYISARASTVKLPNASTKEVLKILSILESADGSAEVNAEIEGNFLKLLKHCDWEEINSELETLSKFGIQCSLRHLYRLESEFGKCTERSQSIVRDYGVSTSEASSTALDLTEGHYRESRNILNRHHSSQAIIGQVIKLNPGLLTLSPSLLDSYCSDLSSLADSARPLAHLREFSAEILPTRVQSPETLRSYAALTRRLLTDHSRRREFCREALTLEFEALIAGLTSSPGAVATGSKMLVGLALHPASLPSSSNPIGSHEIFSRIKASYPDAKVSREEIADFTSALGVNQRGESKELEFYLPLDSSGAKSRELELLLARLSEVHAAEAALLRTSSPDLPQAVSSPAEVTTRLKAFSSNAELIRSQFAEAVNRCFSPDSALSKQLEEYSRILSSIPSSPTVAFEEMSEPFKACFVKACRTLAKEPSGTSQKVRERVLWYGQATEAAKLDLQRSILVPRERLILGELNSLSKSTKQLWEFLKDGIELGLIGEGIGREVKRELVAFEKIASLSSAQLSDPKLLSEAISSVNARKSAYQADQAKLESRFKHVGLLVPLALAYAEYADASLGSDESLIDMASDLIRHELLASDLTISVGKSTLSQMTIKGSLDRLVEAKIEPLIHQVASEKRARES